MDKKKGKYVRYATLAFFFLLIVAVGIRHFIYGGGLEGAPSIDAVCPFGGVESAYTYLVFGNFVPRVMLSSFIILGALVLVTSLFRKGFCGYICPFGAVQEFLGWLRRKLRIKELRINRRIDWPLRYLKYAILIAVIIATAYTGTLVFREYDPYITFFHFGKGILWDVEAEELASHGIAFGILLGVLGGAFLIERFWCKYLCPLGAIMTPLAAISPTAIHRDKKTCTDCKICDKVCPTNVIVSTPEKVTSPECISCMECVDSCPANSLGIMLGGKK